MYGLHQSIQTRKPGSPPPENAPKLVGYTLTPRSFEPHHEAEMRLMERSARAGFRISITEQDIGMASNPFRNGLWRAFRRVMCNQCEPKRMPFSMMNFEDFMHQALLPCPCGSSEGDAGIVTERLEHLSSD